MLSNKPFIVIDLGSGSWVLTHDGHERFNRIKWFDGRYYGYCPPYDNIDIKKLGAKSSDTTIDDVIVVYTEKQESTNNRIIVAFTDSATIHKKRITKTKLQRIIREDGKIVHCSYTIESDYLYNLETYPQKLVIDIRKYNPYMFRGQRFFKGTYKSLDEKIIRYLENYLENTENFEDDLFQDGIQKADYTTKDALKNTYDKEPEYADRGGSPAVIKNVAYAKQALNDAQYLCMADPNHNTFLTNKGFPYMEGHHLIPCTANNAKTFWNRYRKSIDCVENIVCLCPTCHRRIHFGSDEEKNAIIKLLYNKQLSKLKKAGLNISEKELIELYQ